MSEPDKSVVGAGAAAGEDEQAAYERLFGPFPEDRDEVRARDRWCSNLAAWRAALRWQAARAAQPQPAGELRKRLAIAQDYDDDTPASDAVFIQIARDAIAEVERLRECYSRVYCSNCSNTGYIDSDGLCGECDLGRLRMERDMARAEVERLSAAPEPRLFDPARLPPPDDMGMFYHPDIPHDHDNDPEDCSVIAEQLKQRGWELSVQVGDDFVNEETCEYDMAKWEPPAPAGESWQLVAKYDTEDGPAAMFVRPAGAGQPAAREELLREGWVCAPKEPTPEMIAHAHCCGRDQLLREGCAAKCVVRMSDGYQCCTYFGRDVYRAYEHRRDARAKP